MAGTVWQRCTRCLRKVNGRDARQRHAASACPGTAATWAYRVSLGFDADGKRRQQVRGGFETEAEADRARREVLQRLDRGTYVRPSEMTLAEYLSDEWLPATRATLAGGTYRKRERHVHRYTLPVIGLSRLQEVNVPLLERLYAHLLTKGAGHGPLAPSTVVDTHRTLHKAFADAERWGYVTHNPVSAAKAPSLARVKADARSTLRAWTPEQLAHFLRATSTHRYSMVFVVAAMTGARRSEVLALRWSDVDLDAARMTFGRAAVLDADGDLELRDSTKTATSSRTIAIDDHTTARLRSHRAAQATQRLKAGRAWQDLDLVLCQADGTPFSPSAVSIAFRRANDAIEGLPAIRLHDLRHTHATLLLRSGEPVRTVSQRLGHSSATVTMDVYAHVMPGDDSGAATRFAGLLDLRAEPRPAG